VSTNGDADNDSDKGGNIGEDLDKVVGEQQWLLDHEGGKGFL
jgi:hypothetical protein